jgi:molybdopterin-guanine dinucleotide biosynthesis protein A
MEIEAFVLIGGKSSRMGRDKALIKLDGITLAERAANTISTALSPKQIYFVTASKDQFTAQDLPANIPVIFDQYKDRGAYGGLHAALSKAQSEWIFVLACDLPFVSAELLKIMAGLISENFDAVVPLQEDGRAQPLCAFYRSEACLNIVENILQTDEKLPPLRAVFEEVKTRFVQFGEVRNLPGGEKFFLNMNTPEDLKQV